MDHQVGTREEWRKARLDLLKAEKELTRRGDELARRRRELPWVPVEEDYRFDREHGEISLGDLFGARSQLLVYHFMYGPDWDEGCPVCSSVADGFDGIRVHLENHDVALAAISRAPVEKLIAYRQRMGWTSPWVSSYHSNFNFDFGVSYTVESVAGGAEHNFAPMPEAWLDPSVLPARGARAERVRARRRHRLPHLFRLRPGGDATWAMWQWLDRAPLGRNEGDMSWFRRHDEYPA